MRKITFFIISLLLLLSAVRAQPSADKLSSLLSDELLTISDASLMVYDLDADSLLFSHRPHKLQRPASTLKIVTSLAALKRLGCGYTIDTHLCRSGNNLYIKGAIDPLLSYEELTELLSAISAGETIDTLFADCSMMDSVYWGPGWAWDDTPWEFQPYISPLMLCGGCVEVKATPAERGKSPIAECYPPSGFYTIENEATSYSGTAEKFTIMRDWLEGTNTIRLKGDCRSSKSEKMNMFPSAEFFITVTKEILASRDINVKNIAYGTVPRSHETIATIKRPITEIVGEALRESDNLCAEALYYHLGALYGKLPVRQTMGAKIVKGFLEYSSSMPEVYDICDGSGLSPYTLISADIILQSLIQIYEDKEIFDIFMKSLPQAGISGTMKNRLKGTKAYKNIFAKTGTVTGVCTLAGFAKATNGNALAFVIMNSGHPKARAARIWQDKVCETLCR